jgi:hypothetical protein
MRRARLLPILISVLATRSVAAQWQFSADLGASQLRRPDIPQSGAMTIGANAIALGDHGWFRSSALGVLANSQQSTAQALLAGAIVGPSSRPLRGELAGFVSAFGESGYSVTMSGEIMPRLQIGSAARGGALGFGLGGIQHAGTSAGLAHVAGDTWLMVGDEQLATSLSYVKTNGTFVGNVLNATPSYYDLTGAWRHEGRGFGVGASAGHRFGRQHVTSGNWGSADAALWVLPRTALVLGIGRSLDDPVRGVPQTTFASVSLRVSAQPHETISRRRTIEGARVTVQRADASLRRFEIRGVRGTRVEVMGDFTDWSPIALEQAGDVWRLERPITPGLHRIALRIDGGEWIAPVNLPHATDDLGGVVGLITVP